MLKIIFIVKDYLQYMFLIILPIHPKLENKNLK